MEWMATITGDHVGYPGFRDLGDYSPRRKIFGSKNSRVFRRQIFTVESLKMCEEMTTNIDGNTIVDIWIIRVYNKASYSSECPPHSFNVLD